MANVRRKGLLALVAVVMAAFIALATPTQAHALGSWFNNWFSGSGSGSTTSQTTTTTTTNTVPAVLELSATKNLVGADINASDYRNGFTFELKQDGKTIQTVSNNGAAVTFSPIELTKAGTFTFTVTEKSGNLKNVTYANNVQTVTVTVSQETIGSTARYAITSIVPNQGITQREDKVGGSAAASVASRGVADSAKLYVVRSSSGKGTGYLGDRITYENHIAYCLDYDKTYPHNLTYSQVSTTASAWLESYRKSSHSANPYTGTAQEAALKRIAYYGYPNDGSGQMLKYVESLGRWKGSDAKDAFYYATNFAVWMQTAGEKAMFSGTYWKNNEDLVLIQQIANKILSYGSLPSGVDVSLSILTSGSNQPIVVAEPIETITKQTTALSAGAFVNTYTEPTPEPNPEPVVGKITIKKMISETSTILPGATLRIMQGDKVIKDNIAFTGQETIELAPGTYTLVEVKAPDGYEVSDPITFTIDAGKTFTGKTESVKNGAFRSITNFAVYDGNTLKTVASCVNPYRDGPPLTGVPYVAVNEEDFTGLTAQQKAQIKRVIWLGYKYDSMNLKAQYMSNASFPDDGFYQATVIAIEDIARDLYAGVIRDNNDQGRVKSLSDRLLALSKDTSIVVPSNLRMLFFTTADPTLQPFVSLELVPSEVVMYDTPAEPEPDPVIATTAAGADGTKAISAAKDTKVLDTVTYENLKPGTTYTLVGQLVTKSSGGKTIVATAQKTFTPTQANGSEVLVFTVDTSTLAGEKLVAFETLKFEGAAIAQHADINDADQTVSINNEAVVTVVKKWEDANEAADAVEVVLKKNGVKDDTVELNAANNWRYAWTGLDATAEYTVEEQVPAGYEQKAADSATQTDAKGNKAYLFTFTNAKIPEEPEDPTVKISKVDATNATSELPGATLIIRDADGKTVDSWTSTTTIHEVQLAPGTYTLTEITAPDGYEVAETIEFSVNADGLVGSEAVVMQDAPIPAEPTAQTVATNANDSSKVIAPGTAVQVRDVVVYTNLKPGTTYTLEGQLVTKSSGGETVAATARTEFTPEAADGEVELIFTVDASALAGEQLVAFETVKQGDVTIVTHADINDPAQTVDVSTPTVRISKVDATDATSELPGAQLVIRDANGSVVEYWVSTDTIHEVQLAPGTYTLTELTAPNGYEVAETITFVVGEDGLVEGDKVVMQDKPVDPSIATTATDADDGDKGLAIGKVRVADAVQYTNLRPGVEYTMSGKLVTKSSNGEEVVAEAQTTFTPSAANGEVVITFEVDTTALAGEQLVAFESLAQGGKEVAIHADINDPAQTVDVETPEPENPEVEISKVDAATTAELPGAELIIRDADGKVVENWVSTTESHKVVLAPGTYTLTELTAPDGYEKAETITFVVGENGLVEGDKVVMEDAPTPEVPFVKISKVDITDATSELPGAELIIRDANDKIVESWVSTDEVHKVQLAAGTYTLTEVTAPKGYEVAETISFTVNEDGLVGSDVVVMQDKPVDPSIATTATDTADGDKLLDIGTVKVNDAVQYYNLRPGTTYTMSGKLVTKSSNGEVVVAEATQDFTPEAADGEVILTFDVDTTKLARERLVAFETLLQGSAVVAEHADINDADQTVEVKEPDNPTVKISKVDATDATSELPGATLVIRDAADKIVESWKSTDTIHEVQLAPGSYTLEEITAPYGYDLSEIISFEVNEDGLVGSDKVVMEDAPIEPTIATTATDAADGDKELAIGKVLVADAVQYTNLRPGTEYTMSGQLVTKSSGGEVVVAEAQTTFVPEKADGEVVITFEVDTAALAGEELVAFETLTREGVEVAIHADINDPAQTVVVETPEPETPEVEISKVDAATTAELPGAELIVRNEANQVVANWVSTEESHKIQLDPGTYTLTELTAPEGYLKAETITFVVGEDGLVEGDKVVMEDKPVDPAIATTATDAADGDKLLEADQVQVNDAVQYYNLRPGTEYIMSGQLVTKSSNGETVVATATKAFTPDAADGEVVLTFDVDASALAGEQLVAFETLLQGDKEIAVHADINDAAQTVEVPTPEDREEPEKKINGSYGPIHLANRAAKFTYTVSQVVPSNATKVVFTDTLEDVLVPVDSDAATIEESAAIKINANGAVINYDKDTNTVTATIEGDAAKAVRGQLITLVITAQIRDGVSDATLIEKYGEDKMIPNEAVVAINDSALTTNEVDVTPPDEPTDVPEKFINGQKDVVILANRTDSFEYAVTQTVPANATKVVFTDTLVNELEFVGNAEINANGAEVSIEGQTITAALTGDAAKAVRNQIITLKFYAKIRDGITDEQLIAKYGEDKLVPNVATVSINDAPKSTNEVLVTPPDTPADEPVKRINNQTAPVQLTNRNEAFVYSVTQKVPAKATEVVFTDTLEDVLEYVGDVFINANGAVINIDGQTVTATISGDDAKAIRGATITMIFQAKIRADISDEYLIAKYGTGKVVPNQASVVIDGNPKATNVVEVIPPETPEENPVKYVNGKGHEDLTTAEEPFVYTVSATVPADAVKFTISDTIEPVLQFVGDATANAAGAQIGVNGRTITATFDGDAAIALRGRVVTLTFNAKIVSGADLSAYADRTIPNKATYTVNDNPARSHETNTVTVTPPVPATDQEIAKTVNGALHANLGSATEVFNYQLVVGVPTDADKLVITDTLVPELEYATAAKNVSVNVPADVKIDGQTITVTVDPAEAYRGKSVTVGFSAKIRNGVDISRYIDASGNPKVPNVASYTVNDDVKRTYESNTVTVTPPKPVGNVDVIYITTDGKILRETEVIANNAPVDSAYSTNQLTFDGYKFVYMGKDSDAPAGKVIEGWKHVIYVYEPVEQPTGNVDVIYITTDGQILKETEIVAQDEQVGTPYTTDQLEFEGYRFVSLGQTSDAPVGQVVEGWQHVIYMYEPIPAPTADPVGNVDVIYVTTDGQVLRDVAPVVENGAIGSEYTTEQLVFPGYHFVTMDPASAPAAGNVKEETQHVIYVYEPDKEEITTNEREDPKDTPNEEPEPTPDPEPTPEPEKEVVETPQTPATPTTTTTTTPSTPTYTPKTSTPTTSYGSTPTSTPRVTGGSTTTSTPSTARGLSTKTGDTTNVAVVGLGVVAVAAFAAGAWSLFRRSRRD